MQESNGNKSVKKAITRRLQESKRKSGLTHDEITKRLEKDFNIFLSKSAVTKYFSPSNAVVPKEETLIALCDIFDVSSDYILNGERECRELTSLEEAFSYIELLSSSPFFELTDKAEYIDINTMFDEDGIKSFTAPALIITNSQIKKFIATASMNPLLKDDPKVKRVVINGLVEEYQKEVFNKEVLEIENSIKELYGEYEKFCNDVQDWRESGYVLEKSCENEECERFEREIAEKKQAYKEKTGEDFYFDDELPF